MHLALKAYQELLLTVNEMDQSQDENIRQSSSVIKSKSVLTAHVQVNLGPFSGHSRSLHTINCCAVCLTWLHSLSR